MIRDTDHQGRALGRPQKSVLGSAAVHEDACTILGHDGLDSEAAPEARTWIDPTAPKAAVYDLD